MLFIVLGVLALIPFFNATLWVLAPLAIGMCALGWVKGGSDWWRQSLRGNGNEKSAGGKRGKASRDDDTWMMGSGSSSSSGSSGSSGGECRSNALRAADYQCAIRNQQFRYCFFASAR